MLQVTRRVVSLVTSKIFRSLPALSTVRYSSCDPTGIKEAPILDNQCVTAFPAEVKMRNNLETKILMPIIVDLSPVNGIPCSYIRTRTVRIFQPPKNAMQSGTNNIRHWEVEFDNRMRWENPLMGWTSNSDPMSPMRLRFSSSCEAIDYCNKNGWTWFLDVPRTEREFRVKSYAVNFSWDKRTRVSTK